MRRPGGYAITTEPGKADVEEDTFTCGHCGGIVFVKPRQDPSSMGGFCRLCMAHLCAPCADQRSCMPFERRLEALESRDRLRRAAEG